jgi:uncharacterized protein YjcR
MTTIAAAAELGCSRFTVAKWAKRQGWELEGRDYRITPRRLATLRGLVQPGPGRPRLHVRG